MCFNCIWNTICLVSNPIRESQNIVRVSLEPTFNEVSNPIRESQNLHCKLMLNEATMSFKPYKGKSK